jgi:Zn ribbon nucleic-acid-binding protein
MHTREDVYGNFRECLQCGLIQDLKEITNNVKQSHVRNKTEAA